MYVVRLIFTYVFLMDAKLKVALIVTSCRGLCFDLQICMFVSRMMRGIMRKIVRYFPLKLGLLNMGGDLNA